MKLGSLRTALVAGAGISFLATSAFAQDTSGATSGTGQTPGSTPNPASSSPVEPQSSGIAAPPVDPAPGVDAAAPAPEASTDRVIVTGSNIPTAEEVGPNPVITINRDVINKAGERSAEALLRNLPVANANGVPLSNNATGFTPGAASISLRGFGPSATLVLIDGRRLAPYAVGQGGTSSFIDLLSIPRAAIESIEILKDGASTTYGADAVAGVVNIKLRHNYRGAEATVEYGNTLDKDASRQIYDILFGIGDEKTQVTGVIQYFSQEATFNRDRGGLSSKPPFVSTNSSPLNLELSDAVVAAAGGTPATPDSPLTFGRVPFFSDGNTPASDFVYTAGRSSLFNFNAFSGSLPESERYGGYVNFDHKFLGDQLVVFGDFLYNQTETRTELAPAATGSFQTSGQTTLAIPPGMNLNGVAPPNTPTYEETGVPADAFNPFNPFNQIISGGSRARLAEFGNRVFTTENDLFFATIGAKGDKLFDGSWGYDTAFRWSEVKVSTLSDVTSTSRFNRVLNANDPIFDPANNQFIGTTIPYNPFGDFRVPIPSNLPVVDFANVATKDVNRSEQTVIDLNIYTTDLISLPGGNVGFAFGGQFRRESIDQSPDEINLAGDTIGSSPNAITDAGRKTYAIYGEIAIPIFKPDNGVIGFRSLDFTAATRYEEFRNNDSNVVVPKLGLRWQPFDETVTIRTTWGKGYRQPSLFELFGSPTAALSPVVDRLPFSAGGPNTPVGDPSRTNDNREVPILFGSNPALQPEDSNAFSAGIVWTPKWVPGLTLSVDVFGIERLGVVQTPTAQQVVDREVAGGLAPGESVERDASGNLSRVLFGFQNAGQERARGIDFGLQYQLQTGFGTFTSTTNATYTDSFRLALLTGDPALELSNGDSTGTSDDAYLKWRAKSTIDWAWNDFNLLATGTYLAGFHELLFISPLEEGKKKEHWVDSTCFVDVQGSYQIKFEAPVESQPVAGYSKDGKDSLRGKDGKVMDGSDSQALASGGLPIWKQALNNTTITIGCNNVFGFDPPLAFGPGFANSVGYPGFIYDNVGRFLYASLNKKF